MRHGENRVRRHAAPLGPPEPHHLDERARVDEGAVHVEQHGVAVEHARTHAKQPSRASRRRRASARPGRCGCNRAVLPHAMPVERAEREVGRRAALAADQLAAAAHVVLHPRGHAAGDTGCARPPDVERQRRHHLARDRPRSIRPSGSAIAIAPQNSVSIAVAREAGRLAARAHRRRGGGCRRACCSSRYRAGRTRPRGRCSARMRCDDVHGGVPGPAASACRVFGLIFSSPPGTVCTQLEPEVVAGARAAPASGRPAAPSCCPVSPRR